MQPPVSPMMVPLHEEQNERQPHSDSKVVEQYGGHSRARHADDDGEEYAAKPDSEETVEAGDLSEISLIVQNCIDGYVSPYDMEFDLARERYGDRFVEEYVDEVSAHMGEHVVAGFEYHDLASHEDEPKKKRRLYGACANQFKEVYPFLYPSSTEDAYDAADLYTLALWQHDAVEDLEGGFDMECAGDPAKYSDLDTPESREWNELLDNKLWDCEVYTAFDMLDNVLGLTDSFDFDEHREFGTYSRHMAEFFKYHTVATKADGLSTLRRHIYQRQAFEHAWKAQVIRFNHILNDHERAKMLAESYLEAVEAHDEHTVEKQEENRDRMTKMYRMVLDEVTDADA